MNNFILLFSIPNFTVQKTLDQHTYDLRVISLKLDKLYDNVKRLKIPQSDSTELDLPATSADDLRNIIQFPIDCSEGIKIRCS